MASSCHVITNKNPILSHILVMQMTYIEVICCKLHVCLVCVSFLLWVYCFFVVFVCLFFCKLRVSLPCLCVRSPVIYVFLIVLFGCLFFCKLSISSSCLCDCSSLSYVFFLPCYCVWSPSSYVFLCLFCVIVLLQVTCFFFVLFLYVYSFKLRGVFSLFVCSFYCK